jgi:hypothetical protein
MSLLSLNCRGLGNPQTVRELHILVKHEGPDVVFLSETRLELKNLDKIRVKIGMHGSQGVERTGTGGGLALLWKEGIQVTNLSHSSAHIDVTIQSLGTTEWHFTGFYGNPDTSKRHDSWTLLRRLKRYDDMPWLVVGDFNELLDASEKTGRLARPWYQMENFRQALSDCELKDMGYCGNKFTWWNGRHGTDCVYERLDRGVCSAKWFSLFPQAQIRHVSFSNSDHEALMVDLSSGQTRGQYHPQRFRFETIWMQAEGCEEVVRRAWQQPQSGYLLYQVSQRIKTCRMALQRWSRTINRPTKNRVAQARTAYADSEKGCQENRDNREAYTRRNQARRDLNEVLAQEEKYWQQRSPVSWLRDGDRNTRFFHASASQRKKKNTILGLRDANGHLATIRNTMSPIVEAYFHNIFRTSNPSAIAQVVHSVSKTVTQRMNDVLLAPFTSEEIRSALFQMHPTKAPGPDGMNAMFYQKFWHIVGDDVTNAVLEFLHSGKMLKSVNFTHITLIPKIPSPELMTQFRPISLCNVLYKIISKVLANRLKTVLDHIISDNQSAFVPGRLITDNILVAFEALHYMKTKRKGRSTHMAVKLDMSKAYDRVEWNFLENMMMKLGFDQRWVNLIMQCLTSVSYSVMLNGEPTGYIKPTRGIHQGDPLSPYLFLICAEGLTALLQQAERSGIVQGLSICRGGPQISHLFFADDSLLFCRANMIECQNLLAILDTYEQASGQKLNHEKTSLFFSTNTHPDLRHSICTLLRTSSTGDLGKYLGLPPIIGRGKKQAFMEIKQKIAKKLHGWKGKLLSQAGREILIKSVAQAIPVYTMSCFRIPDTLCSEINSMVSKFWWGQKAEEKKIHWQKWSNMCRKKSEGGMGFRDLTLFNQALLAKQGWRLLQHPNTLLHRLLKAKYFPNCSFMEADIPDHASFAWRSIAQSRHIIRKGTRWRIGNGTQVNIWRDKWINPTNPSKSVSQRQILPANATVSDLIDHETRQWNSSLIDSIFWPCEAAQIKAIPLRLHHPDILVWTGTPNGRFTTRSAYMLQLEEKTQIQGSSSDKSRLHAFWKALWRVTVPSKIKTFMWRACTSILPTKTNLFRRGVVHSYYCPVCNDHAETVLHSLWDCEYAQTAWLNSSVSPLLSLVRPSSWDDLVDYVIRHLKTPEVELFFTLAWMIWAYRNATWLNNPRSDAISLSSKATSYVEEFLDSNNRADHPITNNPPTWTPPPNPQYKLNVSWQRFKTRASLGICAVIRDSKGALMAAYCEEIPCAGDGLHNAARSLQKSLIFGQEAGFTHIIVEFSHPLLKSLITADEVCLSELEDTLAQIRVCSNFFHHIAFNSISRSCNKAAKSLAIYAKEITEPSIWIEEGPAILLPIVLAELV